MDFKTYYIIFHDPIWVILLSTALFFPVRQMIWVLYVRKKQKSQKLVSDEERKSLKKRATFTSILLCVVFIIVARSYKSRISHPKGLQSLFEPIILFVRDNIVKPNIGKQYKKYLFGLERILQPFP